MASAWGEGHAFFFTWAVHGEGYLHDHSRGGKAPWLPRTMTYLPATRPAPGPPWKRLLCLALLGICLLPVGAIAQEPAAVATAQVQAPAPDPAPKHFTLTADADVARRSFRVGESIGFRIARKKGAPADQVYAIHYRVLENGFRQLHEGRIPPEQDSREVFAVPERPGFILVRAWEELEGGSPAGRQEWDEVHAGAAVSPEEMVRTTEIPPDFDAFWKKLLAPLKESPIRATEMVPVDSGDPEVLAWDIKITSPGGKPVSGYYARPRQIQPRATPALVIFEGAGVRSAELDEAVEGAKLGTICLQINAHGILNGQPPEYYTQLQQTTYDNYPRRNAKDREKIYFGEMYVRAVRAVEYMTIQPAWNRKHLIVAGQSQGAAQAMAAAALHPAVTAVFAGIPALSDLDAVASEREPGWPFHKATAAKPVPKAFAYFDTANFATRVRVPGLFAVGLEDVIAPPSSGYMAFQAYAGPRRMMIMANTPHILDQSVTEAYREFVREQGTAASVAPPTGEVSHETLFVGGIPVVTP